MKRWLIRSVQVAALAMGGLALTGTAAHADWDSGPNVGFFNGNQSSTTVQIPVNVCGNSLAIIGFASANCQGGGAYAYSGSGGNGSGAGANSNHRRHHGNGNGNGNANANGSGHHKHKHKGDGNGGSNSYHNSSYHDNSYNAYDDNDDDNYGNGGGGAHAYSDNGNWNTGYNVGFFNGNQTSNTFQMPINVSCNSVAVIGFASSC